MKKLWAILCAMVVILCLSIQANALECTAKNGWPFTLTEADLDVFTSIANAKDNAAADQMARQGRLFFFKKGVVVHRDGGFTVCKFRVPGTTVYGYTYCEALDCR